jgi:dTMP kinase
MRVKDTDYSLENFIVLEGIDGSGTTTQMREIELALGRKGISCYTTAEPTTEPIGLFVRSVLSGKVQAEQSTIAYLFAADRHEHVYGKNGILAHLEHEVVLCDRYVLSSLAYQGTVCGFELPQALNSRFPPPGLTLYFSIDPELSMRRVLRRNNLEIYEKMHIQKLVFDAYASAISAARADGWKIIVIDASLPIQAVTSLALEAISLHMKAKV